jgi:protein-arginine kinase activator protein McsA
MVNEELIKRMESLPKCPNCKKRPAMVNVSRGDKEEMLCVPCANEIYEMAQHLGVKCIITG